DRQGRGPSGTDPERRSRPCADELPDRARLRRAAPLPPGAPAPAARGRRRRGSGRGADRPGDRGARPRQPRRRKDRPGRSRRLGYLARHPQRVPRPSRDKLRRAMPACARRARCKVGAAAAFSSYQEVAMPVPSSRLAVRIAVPCLLTAALGYAACGTPSYRYAAAPPRYAIVAVGPIERPAPGMNTEAYDRITDNPFLAARDNPLSTFSIDVDTASYANVRRFLHDEHLPPADAVRIEEMVNYFHYASPPPEGAAPIAVTTEVGPRAWNAEHRLVRIGLRARSMGHGQAPARHPPLL